MYNMYSFLFYIKFYYYSNSYICNGVLLLNIQLSIGVDNLLE